MHELFWYDVWQDHPLSQWRYIRGRNPFDVFQEEWQIHCWLLHCSWADVEERASWKRRIFQLLEIAPSHHHTTRVFDLPVQSWMHGLEWEHCEHEHEGKRLFGVLSVLGLCLTSCFRIQVGSHFWVTKESQNDGWDLISECLTGNFWFWNQHTSIDWIYRLYWLHGCSPGKADFVQ